MKTHKRARSFLQKHGKDQHCAENVLNSNNIMIVENFNVPAIHFTNFIAIQTRLAQMAKSGANNIH